MSLKSQKSASKKSKILRLISENVQKKMWKFLSLKSQKFATFQIVKFFFFRKTKGFEKSNIFLTFFIS